MMPTLHEVFNSVANKEKSSIKKFARWGESLLKSGGPHLKKWMKAIKESPLMTDLAGGGKTKSAHGWFTGIFDIFGLMIMIMEMI